MAESSRIFVRGLPPSLTEDDFKSHFGKRYPITDAKLFQKRRIGYVGFKTVADATSAVKYFNKSFIRMSKIGVEIAQPYQTSSMPEAQVQSHENNRPPSDVQSKPEGPIPLLKRKRDGDDAKLQEYLGLMKAPSKLRSWIDDDAIPSKGDAGNSVDVTPLRELNPTNLQSAVPKDKEKPLGQNHPSISFNLGSDKNARPGHQPPAEKDAVEVIEATDRNDQNVSDDKEDTTVDKNATNETSTSDSDWLRSRTSRLLGLVEDDEEEATYAKAPSPEEDSINVSKTSALTQELASEGNNEQEIRGEPVLHEDNSPQVDENVLAIQKSRRLFIRNLPFSVEEDDLTELFAPIGELAEVHVPVDGSKRAAKGFAYVEFLDAQDAIEALRKFDGTVFQGRLLHILPAANKRETRLDDFAVSQLPLKKQKQIQRKSEAASSSFNWNFMYMNPDAVIGSISDSLGISKADLLDPTSSDSAVKQAQAEAHIIQATKTYFESNGVNLKAFNSRKRSDKIILIKNFQYGTKANELRKLFEDYGEITRFLMPPSGTIGIIEFLQSSEARSAFHGMAYRKLGGSVLFLEKAPETLFDGAGNQSADLTSTATSRSHAGLLESDKDDEDINTSTLFVKNLNFSTTNEKFKQTFEVLDGFISARVKMKSDVLSAGFGFLEFRTKEQAQAALIAMNGYDLDGHRLEMKASHKGEDVADERRKEDAAKRKKMRKSKIIIKNLPFETTKKDVRNLFKTYGQLRAVRVPKKFDNTTKGYAFAEFTTPREAESAMEALRHVHFLGRRLNMEFASGEIEDAEKEIEKMQQKVGRQSDTVALQKLQGAGRHKFNPNGADDEMMDV